MVTGENSSVFYVLLKGTNKIWYNDGNECSNVRVFGPFLTIGKAVSKAKELVNSYVHVEAAVVARSATVVRSEPSVNYDFQVQD